jgi:Bifunctional DNA primase/polymerase, N-terminal
MRRIGMQRLGTSGLLRAALDYAARGIPVFPCHHPANNWPLGRWSSLECSCQQLGCLHPGEHALSQRWLDEASTDAGQLERWWSQHPEANIGLVTGVVFDVVDVAGAAGSARYPQGITPAGPVARTGSGRWHYFVCPTGFGDVAVPSQSAVGARSRLHWHGRGGYVLAAPSRHSTGAATRWLRGLDLPLPEVPDVLHALLTPPTPQPARARLA